MAILVVFIVDLLHQCVRCSKTTYWQSTCTCTCTPLTLRGERETHSDQTPPICFFPRVRRWEVFRKHFMMPFYFDSCRRNVKSFKRSSERSKREVPLRLVKRLIDGPRGETMTKHKPTQTDTWMEEKLVKLWTGLSFFPLGLLCGRNIL